MSVKPYLSTNLSQRLVLTPQMRQRIELLAMTKVELNDLVSTQLSENPVLEELAPDESPDQGSLQADEQSSSAVNAVVNSAEAAPDMAPDAEFYSGESKAPSVESTTPVDEFSSEPIDRERDSFEEVDFGSFSFEEYLDPGYRTREVESKEDGPSFENMLTRPLSLEEHLSFQLRLSEVTPEVLDCGEEIIGNLNEDGFLAIRADELGPLGNWSPEVVEKALSTIQRLDPVGVATIGPREALLVQMDDQKQTDRLAYRLVSEYFDRLQPHRMPDLAKSLGVSVEEIKSEVDYIKTLDPHPGRKYSGQSAHYIEPEVYIEKIDDEYHILFNDDGMPQLRINPMYRRMMNSEKSTKEEKDYIKDRFRSAIDLLKNIDHRKQTIYRVCKSIVDRQREFLDKGVEYLRPMMLKDIAEDIGIHLSTVSRVVNRKYVHTPQGVIELRRFFTEGMISDDGEEISTRVLKLQIKKMIESEDSKHPITDDYIAKRLAREGVKMSRRTVAKYREQMRIPGSRERRAVV